MNQSAIVRNEPKCDRPKTCIFMFKIKKNVDFFEISADFFEDVIFLFRIIFGGYFRVFTLNFFVIDFFRVFLCISPKIFEIERGEGEREGRAILCRL